MEQSSSDHSSPALHESLQEASIPSVSSAAIPAEPSVQLETIHEVEELEVWVHIETFQLSHDSISQYNSNNSDAAATTTTITIHW